MAYVSLGWDTARLRGSGTNLVVQSCVVNRLLMLPSPSVPISNMGCSWRPPDVVATGRLTEITDMHSAGMWDVNDKYGC